MQIVQLFVNAIRNQIEADDAALFLFDDYATVTPCFDRLYAVCFDTSLPQELRTQALRVIEAHCQDDDAVDVNEAA